MPYFVQLLIADSEGQKVECKSLLINILNDFYKQIFASLLQLQRLVDQQKMSHQLFGQLSIQFESFLNHAKKSLVPAT